MSAPVAELAQRLSGLRSDADDLAEQVRELRCGFEFEPGELDEIEGRLDVIYRLKKEIRRHGGGDAGLSGPLPEGAG